jgi:E3 ubiquitin-protein ligase BRE1
MATEMEQLRAENARLHEAADAAKTAAAKAIATAAATTSNPAFATDPTGVLLATSSPPQQFLPPPPPPPPPPQLVVAPQPVHASLVTGASAKLPPKKLHLLQQQYAQSPAFAMVAAPTPVEVTVAAPGHGPEIQDLLKRLEDTTRERDELRQAQVRLRCELDNLTEDRIKTTPFWRLLTEQFENMHRSLMEDRARLESALVELGQERTARAAADVEATARRQDAENLHGQLATLQRERDRFFEEKNEIAAKLNDPDLHAPTQVDQEARATLLRRDEQCKKLRDEVGRLREELALERQLKTSSTTGGAPPPPPQLSPDAMVATLRKQIEELKKREGGLVEEIGVISQAYEEMQEQNTRLLQQLAQREDANLRLAREKIKLELAVGKANDEKAQYKMGLAEALKRSQTFDEQLEKKEARIRELTREVTAATEAQRAAASKMNELRILAQDAQIAANETRSRSEVFRVQGETKIKELQEALVERDKERTAREKVEAERDSLRKKIADDEKAAAQMPGGGSGRVRELEAELEDFRRKFRCPLCNDREKNTIIRRCCHVFCDVCIRDAIKARQRKCPGCLKPFSESDVQKIWL